MASCYAREAFKLVKVGTSPEVSAGGTDLDFDDEMDSVVPSAITGRASDPSDIFGRPTTDRLARRAVLQSLFSLWLFSNAYGNSFAYSAIAARFQNGQVR